MAKNNIWTFNYFMHNDKPYYKGTKFLLNGAVTYGYDKTICFNNEEVEFIKVTHGAGPSTTTFNYNNRYYYCNECEFKRCIVGVGIEHESQKHLPKKEEILADNNSPDNTIKEYYIPPANEKQKEIIWDDWMVAKTLWYIVIMLVATIFYGRIGIWVLATIVWWFTTIQNAPRV